MPKYERCFTTDVLPPLRAQQGRPEIRRDWIAQRDAPAIRDGKKTKCLSLNRPERDTLEAVHKTVQKKEGVR